MENVALQSQLQAISLGASLAQRRIENERIRQQLQMRAADQVIQNQQAALQMKMQETQLASTLREQEAMNTEFDAFNQFNQQVAEFLNSGGEGARIPQAPAFKSKTYQSEALKAVNGLDQYSERARSMKLADQARLEANRMEQKMMDEAIKFGAFKTDPETGMPMRGPNGVPLIDFNTLNAKREKELKMKEAIDQQRLLGGITETGVQNSLKSLSGIGLLDETNTQDVAEAYSILKNKTKVPAVTAKSIASADEAVVQLSDALSKIESFNQKYGANAFDEYVGPIDNPVFKATGKFKGLTTQEQQDARLIQQQIASVIQNFRKDLYGATLTPSEQKTMDNVVGTAAGRDYVVLTKGFNDTLKQALGNKMKVYRLYPDIPVETKKRYAPEVFVGAAEVVEPAATPAGTNSAQSVLPSGWSFQP
jgi:hypothetical protein